MLAMRCIALGFAPSASPKDKKNYAHLLHYSKKIRPLLSVLIRQTYNVYPQPLLDITLPVPQDGMTVQEAEQLQLTAAKTVYGDYYLDDTMVKISVNGAPARVMISGPYFPSFSCVLTVPGGKGGNLKKESLYGDYNANKKKYRASHNIYSKETADACCANLHPHDVVTITTPCHSLKAPTACSLPRLLSIPATKMFIKTLPMP